MIGVIADDLTGAAELGGLALRCGLRAVILFEELPAGEKPSGASSSFSAPTSADVLCIDTDSRACASAEAGRRAASAAVRLKNAGATLIYKKVDSVLRGQVTAEIEAIMGTLGLKRAILAPANPSLGRTIRNGVYFVSGRPIHETEFARDPGYPRTSSLVLHMVHQPTCALCCCKPGEPVPPEGITLAEVETSADVEQWARRAHEGVLLAGGAEFFGSVLETMHGPGSDSARQSSADTESAGSPTRLTSRAGDREVRELFVCGSTSDATREFVSRTAQQRTASVVSLPPELASGAELSNSIVDHLARQADAAFGRHSRVILNIGLPPVQDPFVASRLSRELVRVACAVLQRAKPGKVFAEGGATAVELVHRMAWQPLTVLRELAPGVVTLQPQNSDSLELTVKPGSYRWPAQLSGFAENQRNIDNPAPGLVNP